MPNIIAEWRRKSIDEKSKRKTSTSSAVKNRYNAKAYRKFQASIKPELAAEIDEYTEAHGLSKPQFLEAAIKRLKE